jgi:hypothetical protein
MNWLLWGTCGGIALLLLIMGVFLLMGKGAFLIAGFNMMPPAEKARYNVRKLTFSVGILLILTAVLMMVMTVAIHFDLMWLVIVTVALMTVVPIVFVVYANTGGRFKR